LAGPFSAGLAFSNAGVNWPFYLAALAVLPAIWLALSARTVR